MPTSAPADFLAETLGARQETTANLIHVWHRAKIELRPHGGERSRNCARPAPRKASLKAGILDIYLSFLEFENVFILANEWSKLFK